MAASDSDIPVQIEVHGLTMSASIRELLETHIRKLQDHYGKLMAGRVVIRAPGAHHRTGEPYAVSIHLTLPDQRQINAKRISTDHDPRLADLSFAIHDAFRRAEHQLSRQAEKLEGEVKIHQTPTGRIVRLDGDRSCGILASEDNREIYFHAHSVLDGKFDKLAVGDRVAYHEEMGREGPQASTVRLLGGHRA